MKARGSFGSDMGIPEMPRASEIPKKAPTAEELDKAAATPEKVEEEKIRTETIEKLQKSLGIVMTEDDIWLLLFGNTLEKRNICIVPRMMYATFRTISMGESNYIENKLGEATETKILKRGFDNLNTQYLLAAGVLELGKPSVPRSLGNSIEERFTALEGMSAFAVDQISRKWFLYMQLIDLLLQRATEQGNS